MAGDLEEPGGKGRAARAIPGQRFERLQKDLLCQVSSLFGAARLCAQIAIDRREITSIEYIEVGKVRLGRHNQRGLIFLDAALLFHGQYPGVFYNPLLQGIVSYSCSSVVGVSSAHWYK